MKHKQIAAPNNRQRQRRIEVLAGSSNIRKARISPAESERDQRGKLMPMTHVQEIGAENPYQKTGTVPGASAIWYRIFPLPVFGNE